MRVPYRRDEQRTVGARGRKGTLLWGVGRLHNLGDI